MKLLNAKMLHTMESQHASPISASALYLISDAYCLYQPTSPEFHVSLSLPVILSERGIEKVIPIPLNASEKEQLKKAAEHLTGMTKKYRA